MPPCAHCDALLDQPATTEPHAHLQGSAVYTDFGNVLERYSCALCGTSWERWKAKSRDASYQWTRLVVMDRQHSGHT